MSTPLEADSQLRLALVSLAEAEERYRYFLDQGVVGLRRAAAHQTDTEIKSWKVSISKLWHAQAQLVQKFGDVDPGPTKGRGAIRTRARKSWLGNLVGLFLPLWLFGAARLAHSFALPLSWAAALAADFSGRAYCLRMARLDENAVKSSAAKLFRQVDDSLANARNKNEWKNVVATIGTMATAGQTLKVADRRLKKAQRRGSRVTLLGFALFVITFVLNAPALVILILALFAVFGLALWTTASSYQSTMQQPPYPTPVSGKRLQQRINAERELNNLPVSSFNTLKDLEARASGSLLRLRPLRIAFRNVHRAENTLEDARWQVAILKAESGQ